MANNFVDYQTYVDIITALASKASEYRQKADDRVEVEKRAGRDPINCKNVHYYDGRADSMSDAIAIVAHYFRRDGVEV